MLFPVHLRVGNTTLKIRILREVVCLVGVNSLRTSSRNPTVIDAVTTVLVARAFTSFMLGF